MTERISILVPNYNKGSYLEDCIKTVLQQTCNLWDLYILDDGSSDESKNILDKFKNIKNIHISFNNKNMGLPFTLDKLIKESKNSICCYLGSDDGIRNDTVEKFLEFYKNNPKAQFVYCNFWFCDINLNKIRPGWSRPLPNRVTNLVGNCISAMQSFRKETYFKTKGLDLDLKAAVDKDLIYKLEEIARPMFLNESLYFYRGLIDSMSRGVNIPLVSRMYAIVKQRTIARRMAKKAQ
jgi:glycosyltransferase involved in cell wall biosynthesis